MFCCGSRRMTMKLIFFLFLSWVVFLPGANAQEIPKVPKIAEDALEKTEPLSMDNDKGLTYLLCKFKKLVRTVRVEKNSGGGCKTIYTKDGTDQNVGESLDGKICLKVLRNIRINLEKANWKCKDISESRVSTSEP